VEVVQGVLASGREQRSGDALSTALIHGIDARNAAPMLQLQVFADGGVLPSGTLEDIEKRIRDAIDEATDWLRKTLKLIKAMSQMREPPPVVEEEEPPPQESDRRVPKWLMDLLVALTKRMKLAGEIPEYVRVIPVSNLDGVMAISHQYSGVIQVDLGAFLDVFWEIMEADYWICILCECPEDADKEEQLRKLEECADKLTNEYLSGSIGVVLQGVLKHELQHERLGPFTTCQHAWAYAAMLWDLCDKIENTTEPERTYLCRWYAMRANLIREWFKRCGWPDDVEIIPPCPACD